MDYPRADAFFSDCIGKENIPGSEGSHAIESCSGIVTSDPSLSSPASPVVLDLSNRKRNSNLGESGDDRESRSQNRSRSTPGESRKPRKPRAPSLRPLDADANPGEDIDPTVITMAALCSDTGQGRVSSKAAEIQSNHVAWRAASRDKSARMKSLVEARKFRGRDDDKDDPRSSGTQSNKSPIVGPSLAGGSPAGVSQQEGPAAEDGSGQGFDYSQGLATSRFNVQVRIGLNGETFIDEESLFVDRSHEDNTEQYTHVEESEHTKFVNSGTYGKKVRGSRWGAEETELFYHASRVLSSIIIPDITFPARLSLNSEKITSSYPTCYLVAIENLVKTSSNRKTGKIRAGSRTASTTEFHMVRMLIYNPANSTHG